MTAPLARLFALIRVARCMARASLNSVELTRLYPGQLFHGERVGEWVQRLPSEGGGYVFWTAVREL